MALGIIVVVVFAADKFWLVFVVELVEVVAVSRTMVRIFLEHRNLKEGLSTNHRH